MLGSRSSTILICALTFLASSPILAQQVEARAREARRLREQGHIDAAVTLLRSALRQTPGNETLSLLLAETLGWQKHFDEAESIYREVLQRSSSPAAKKGLARVLLWRGRYGESRELARTLLKISPRDVDAQEIAAIAAYWSGDFRSAEREFSEIVRLHPERSESRRSLLEIRSAARPLMKAGTDITVDNQPYRLTRTSAEGSFFSDPLTRWDATIGTYAIDPPRGRAGSFAPFASAGGEITFPSRSLVIRPRLGLIRLPDGETRPIGSLSGTVRTSEHSRLTVDGQRRELLTVRDGSDDHVTVDVFGAGFHLEPKPYWSGDLRAEILEYSDGNRGESVSGYLLAPVGEIGGARLSAGCSVLWRDTDQTRFRVDTIRAVPTANFFTYRYDGVYDPYHTPQSLKEARLLISLGITRGLMTGRIRGDLGIARDRATDFGPRTGPAPAPNIDLHPVTFDREFHPWRLAVEVSRALTPHFEIRASYERSFTSEYRAHTAHASLVRRF